MTITIEIWTLDRFYCGGNPKPRVPIGRVTMTTSNRALAALEEVRRLLDGLRFDRGGIFLQKELASVSLGVEPTDNPELLEAHLTVHGPGSLVVDWSEVAFFVGDHPKP